MPQLKKTSIGISPHQVELGRFSSKAFRKSENQGKRPETPLDRLIAKVFGGRLGRGFVVGRRGPDDLDIESYLAKTLVKMSLSVDV